MKILTETCGWGRLDLNTSARKTIRETTVELKAQDERSTKEGAVFAVRDQEIRAALDQHWAASDANYFERSTASIHREDALEYPQLGELNLWSM